MEIYPPFLKSGRFVRLPHPALMPFITQYILERISVPKGCSVNRFIALSSTCSIDFFFGKEYDIRVMGSEIAGNRVEYKIQGPRTKMSECLRIRSDFVSFKIKFKPTGFYRLLGTATCLPENEELDVGEFSLLPLPDISIQLVNASDIGQCAQIIEPYLLLFAAKSRQVPEVIEKAAAELEDNNQSSISKLAVEAFVSLRQLERSFIRYVGTSPKSYFRTNRLLKLLAAKKNHPDQKWGALAHEFGFYDQMHFVKEFKYFLRTTPTAFDLSAFPL